jgi:N-formylglutamate amidohydrolase
MGLSARGPGLVLALLAGACAPAAQAAGHAPENYVHVRRGALPILLTAPHGGRDAIPGIALRDVKAKPRLEDWRKYGGAIAEADTNSHILALRVAAEIGKLTGKEPYLVVAKFSRKYIDANRPPELALDDPKALPYYGYYQDAIRRFVEEIRGRYPAGVLLDVHTQAKGPDVLMRGTQNGRAVARLTQRAGAESITGPSGLFGLLERNGFKVFPGNDVPPQGRSEDAGFNGGYTVQIYGSHKADGIDAVQLEFGYLYLRKEALEKSATQAARAIVAFHAAYLAPPPGR